MASKLSQDDFRKLVNAPRPGSGATVPNRDEATAANKPKKKEDTERRKKKREYLKQQEERNAEAKEREAKYRDRAEERRKGVDTDHADHSKLIDAYNANAVADAGGMEEITAEEKRLLEIENSKFLGGDMEHTHLVKGLDYQLLQKARAEAAKQAADAMDEDPEVETVAGTAVAGGKGGAKKGKEKAVTFRTRIARGIYNTLFNSEPPMRNLLFQPGRMAYVVDLEDDRGVADIPTTITRSKEECPDVQRIYKTSTNDIVIDKLTQILNYRLKTGSRQSKKKKKRKQVASASAPSFSGAPRAVAAEEDEDDDDMYADMDTAGDGVGQPASMAKLKGKKSTASYFGGEPKSADAGKGKGKGEGKGGPQDTKGAKEDPAAAMSFAKNIIAQLQTKHGKVGLSAGAGAGDGDGDGDGDGPAAAISPESGSLFKRKASKAKAKFRGQTVMATAYDSEDEDDEAVGGKLKQMETLVNEEDMMLMMDGVGGEDDEDGEKKELEVSIKKKGGKGKDGDGDGDGEGDGDGDGDGDGKFKKRRREKGKKKGDSGLSKKEEKHFDKELSNINKFIEKRKAEGGMKSSLNTKKAKTDRSKGFGE